MTWIRDLLIGSALVLFGFACVGTEAYGVYEFMWAKEHGWTYLVVGSIIVTLATAFLPMGAEAALRRRRFGWVIICWLAIPIVIGFVFSVGIERTGSSADQSEEARQDRAAARATAQEMIEEAKEQRKKDQKAIDDNCRIWGPICTQAKEDLRKTEAKLDRARAALLEKGTVGMTESMAGRVVAVAGLVGIRITKEQVQTFHPMLLPMLLGFLGPALVGVGLAVITSEEQTRKAGWLSRLLGHLKPLTETPKPPASEMPMINEPVSVLPSPPPKAARPRLVASSNDSIRSHVNRIMKPAVSAARGKHVSMADCLLHFDAERRSEGAKAGDPNEFMLAMLHLCKVQKIKTAEIDGQPWLLDVQLASVPLNHALTT